MIRLSYFANTNLNPFWWPLGVRNGAGQIHRMRPRSTANGSWKNTAGDTRSDIGNRLHATKAKWNENVSLSTEPAHDDRFDEWRYVIFQWKMKWNASNETNWQISLVVAKTLTEIKPILSSNTMKILGWLCVTRMLLQKPINGLKFNQFSFPKCHSFDNLKIFSADALTKRSTKWALYKFNHTENSKFKQNFDLPWEKALNCLTFKRIFLLKFSHFQSFYRRRSRVHFSCDCIGWICMHEIEWKSDTKFNIKNGKEISDHVIKWISVRFQAPMFSLSLIFDVIWRERKRTLNVSIVLLNDWNAPTMKKQTIEHMKMKLHMK